MARGTGVASLEVGDLAGLTVGLYTVMDFEGPLALRPELNYVEKESAFGDDVLQQPGYFELPVLLEVHLMDERSLSPVVFGGPAVGLGHEEYSLILGAGADYRVDEGKIAGLSLDVRYEVGLTEQRRGISHVTTRNVSRKTTGFTDFHNQGLLVTAGVTFQWEPIESDE